MSHTTDLLLTTADKHNVKINAIDKKRKIYGAERNGKRRLLYKGWLPINNVVSAKLCQNKHITKSFLKKAGYNVPRGIHVTSKKRALKALKEGKIHFPLVVKPADRSYGVDVFTNINSEYDLEKCLVRALRGNKRILVEEHIQGNDYRILVIENKIFAVAERLPPMVIGDGKSTVRILISKLESFKNLEIESEYEIKRRLANERLTLNTILEKNRRFVIRGNSNMSTGAVIIDKTDVISEYFKKIMLSIAQSLDTRICGIDIITEDISHENADYSVIEVNNNPGFRIHLHPSSGISRDASGAIWDAIFNF